MCVACGTGFEIRPASATGCGVGFATGGGSNAIGVPPFIGGTHFACFISQSQANIPLNTPPTPHPLLFPFPEHP